MEGWAVGDVATDADWRAAFGVSTIVLETSATTSAASDDFACIRVDSTSAWDRSSHLVSGKVMFDDGEKLCICIDPENEPDEWVCS